MDFKKIDKKYYLLGIIGFLFFLALGSVVRFKTANSLHKDLRLRIDYFSLNDQKNIRSFDSHYIHFVLKDCIIADGVSKGKYLAFGENEDGFDVPLSVSYFPSFSHPSAACISDRYSVKSDNINDMMIDDDFYIHDTVAYLRKLIIQMAVDREATICAILPSYSEYGHYFTDLEIDGTRLSKLVDDEMNNTEWIVDSLMIDIYRELNEYCGNEHCNVGNDYVSIIANSLKKDKVDGFNCLCKREKARFKIRNWLEANQSKIKQLTKGCPDMLNAASQLLDNYHWINQESIKSLLTQLDTVPINERRDVISRIGYRIGYKGDVKFQCSSIYSAMEFWHNHKKDGDAEWTKNWLKSIAE